MVKVVSGDIFSGNYQAITNTVNCVGVMGNGIALEFKTRYPDMFNKYVLLCKENKIQVGQVWLWYRLADTPEFIVNFPTKKHWRNPSELEWIESGLDNLRTQVVKYSITTLALPALGCANGGLKFDEVLPLIENKLSDLDTKVFVFSPK